MIVLPSNPFVQCRSSSLVNQGSCPIGRNNEVCKESQPTTTQESEPMTAQRRGEMEHYLKLKRYCVPRKSWLIQLHHWSAFVISFKFLTGFMHILSLFFQMWRLQLCKFTTRGQYAILTFLPPLFHFLPQCGMAARQEWPVGKGWECGVWFGWRGTLIAPILSPHWRNRGLTRWAAVTRSTPPPSHNP